MQTNSALALDELETENFSTGENFADLLEETLPDAINEGSVAKGTIVSIDRDMAVVDVGLKSEGRVPLKEFAIAGEIPEIKIGEQFDIFIERIEDRNGDARLSREKALREAAWFKLEELHKNGERVDGTIFGRVKGGFTVDVQGAVAFLPGSQVDIRPIKDVTPLMNVEQPFIILKMDRKRGNIVVSRRAILEESRAEARTELLDKISEGQELDGIVKNITDYGAFVDLGGVDGLLHVTDISWKRINHPSEVFSVGDSIRVVVTKFDQSSKRISLGMKQLESNPWEGIEGKFSVGQRITGKISNITDYGAFIDLGDGLEGLVHVSEMSWTNKNLHPSKLVQQGDDVEVEVLDIDMNKQRISLGMKQCVSNPWEKFQNEFKEGDIVKGQVRNITDFGLFVGLEGDIDGLVHHSDISWTQSGEESIKEYQKGSEVEARILAIDIEKERISLGIKQLTDNPNKEAMAGISKGQIVTCKVTDVQKDGIEVEVNENVTSFIKRADLSRERQEQRPDRFAVGDRIDAKVTSVDDKTMRVNLSIKVLEQDEHRRAIKEYGSVDSGASLGDILGAALAESSDKDDSKKDD